MKTILEKELYANIKDLSQVERYYFLKEWMNKMNFEFHSSTTTKLRKIFDDVFSYFNNRSKWKNLCRARDEIIRLNCNIKIENPVKEANTLKSYEVSANDTQEWRVRIYKD
jgi:hypothetical protein